MTGGIATRDRRLEILSLSSFVLLGLPDGMIGTAWPAIRRTFHAPVGDLGLVLLAATAGSAAISVVAGRLYRHFSVPALLGAAAASAMAGALGIAGAPALWLVCAVITLIGAGGGLIDAALNTEYSLQGRQRLLNLLHTFYSVGTATGPLLVTVAILTASWRVAYVALAGCELAVGLLWVRSVRSTGVRRDAPGSGTSEHAQPVARPARYRRVLLLGMVTFFLYTGLEVAAGQWEASYGRGHLHLSPANAGFATFAYWAALTAARLGLALPRRSAPALTVVLVGCLGAIAAAALVWAAPDAAVAVAGFALLGASLGGVFPSLVTLTPGRVGTAAAHDVISWQIGAAVVGGSGLSALIGLLIELAGLGVVGPALFVLALLLALTNSGLTRATAR